MDLNCSKLQGDARRDCEATKTNEIATDNAQTAKVLVEKFQESREQGEKLGQIANENKPAGSNGGTLKNEAEHLWTIAKTAAEDFGRILKGGSRPLTPAQRRAQQSG